MLLLLFVGVRSVSGVTKTWDRGAYTNNWSDGNNWSPNGVPASGDDVIIPNNYSVTVNTAAVCTSLTVNSGSNSNTITISGSNSLSVSAAVAIGAGTGKNDNKIIAVGTGTFSCGSITVTAAGSSNRSSGVSLSTGTIIVSGNISMGDINDDFTFTGAGTLYVGGNMSGGTFNASTGTVNYNGTTQTIGAYVYNNLTISGVGANSRTAGGNVTVNGILNLSSANASITQGCLETGAYTLNMGAAATTTGTGDVTGIVTRTSFVVNKPYSFGNQFTTLNLAAGGTLPTSVSFKIVLTSSNLSWKTNAIHRYYDIIKTGGDNLTKVVLNLHYLHGELNGTTEANLSLFDYHVTTTQLDDHGQSDNNIIDNWVGLSNLNLTQAAPSSSFGFKYWTIGTDTGTDCIWIGVVSTDWNDAGNWTGGIPVSSSHVIIPDAGTTPNDPVLPASTTIGYLLIQSGGILNATTGTPTLSIVGGDGAWENIGGTFNCGTSTIFFSSTLATMAGITNFYNVTVADSAFLTLATNNIMRIAGVLSLSTTGILNATLDNNKVEYNGTNQTIVFPNGSTTGYHDLTLSGSGIKIMPLSAMNVYGDLTMGSGTTIMASPFVLSVGGNWSNSGIFTAGSSTVNFNGSVAQTIGGSSSTTFNNLRINNNTGATLLTAASVVGIITLTNGVLTTSATNLLSVNNTSTTAVVGGSTTTFINGPIKWTLPESLASGSTYVFPIGKGSTYLPFSLVNPTTGSSTPPSVQVEAFAGASAGVADSTTVSSISTSEYWSLTPTGSYTNSSVSIARPTAISPNNVVASSPTVNGRYSNLGGTFDTFGVYGSTSTTNQFFVLAVGKVASMNVSANTLYGLNYSVGNGPSNELSFKVSGILLTGNIIVAPPSTNYEISILSGGIFQTTPITLTKDSTNQVSTSIYVRLRSGLSLGNYESAITVASSGFTTQNINCYGTVVPPISVGGGGSYCVGDTIKLSSSGPSLTNQYWTGPNNFYSLYPNPAISSATTAMSGTYTVNGNYVPVGNLITNGDFSLGNIDFITSYTLAAQTSTGLVPEGTYDVVALPSSRHSNFCSCGDHTTGSGLQMVINGASTAGVNIWSPSTVITVTPYTNYQFTYWVQTVVNGNDPAPSKLQLFVNNLAAGPVYTANPQTGVWTQFVYDWYSGSNTAANLSLINQNTATNGNDFALDDIVFQPVYTSSSSVNVAIIPPGTPASVSIAASPGSTVNSGTNVTFNATPINGGTSPTYQWLVNGLPITGATALTYSYIPINNDSVTCSMTSSSSCLTGSNPVSSSVIVTVNAAIKNYWYGGTSTNWGTASNWTAGYVPSIGDIVEFSTDSTQGNAVRDLVLDKDRTIGRLINATTNPIRQLIIPPARELIINDSILIPQTYIDSSRIYIQAYPDGTQQNGSLIFHNKTAKVYGSVEMFSKASWSSVGYQDNTTGIFYHYSWEYFGIPVSTIAANPTFAGSYVRSWYEPGTNMTNHWISLTNDSILRSFYGYEITQQVLTGKTIVFQGQLVNWDWISPILAKSTATSVFPGEYIFANPYTAAIDISKINLGADTDGSVYLYSTGLYAAWDNGGSGTSNTSSPGQYQTVPLSTAGQNGIPAQIPSMGAFLIKLTQGSQSTSTVGIPYSSVVKNEELQRTKASVRTSTTDMVSTRIDVTGSTYSDRMWLFSNPSCSRSFDKGWDGYKMLGNELTPQLYAIEPDGEYQIDAVNDINNTVLGFKHGVDMEYTFTFTHENMDTRYAGIYLIDSVENKVIDITLSGSQYKFVVDTMATCSNRFKIVTRNIEQNTEPNTNESSSKIKVFDANGIIFVQNLSGESGEFSLFDISGRQLNTTKFEPNSLASVGFVAGQGVYIGRAITQSERVTKKIIVR